jgi:hypothetical protein
MNISMINLRKNIFTMNRKYMMTTFMTKMRSMITMRSLLSTYMIRKKKILFTSQMK